LLRYVVVVVVGVVGVVVIVVVVWRFKFWTACSALLPKFRPFRFDERAEETIELLLAD
tara:strand:- start:4052 stop:4225 length:174 start_codon:yes stop_codon:yes gene_type:complete